MEIRLTQIGSSRGIRLPKLLIEKYELVEGIQLTEMEDGILIQKSKKPREGWSEAFQKCAEQDPGEKELRAISNKWDEEEWEW